MASGCSDDGKRIRRMTGGSDGALYSKRDFICCHAPGGTDLLRSTDEAMSVAMATSSRRPAHLTRPQLSTTITVPAESDSLASEHGVLAVCWQK